MLWIVVILIILCNAIGAPPREGTPTNMSIAIASTPPTDSERCSYKKCINTFTIINDTSYFYPNILGENQPCAVRNFTTHRNYPLQKAHKILYVGDSFDLHSCMFLQTYGSFKPAFGDRYASVDKRCFETKGVQVEMYRFSVLVKQNASSIEAHIEQYKPQTIVFGSFAWDLKEAQEAYCAKHKNSTNERDRCLCSYIQFEKLDCHYTSRAQTFNSLAIPWCDDRFMLRWTEAFRAVVKQILTKLPSATLFLRTHPIASSLMMGNSYCLATMNAIVRQIAGELSAASDGGCRLLDMHALLARGQAYHGIESLEKHDKMDHLHYHAAAHLWTQYLMNSVLENIH